MGHAPELRYGNQRNPPCLSQIAPRAEHAGVRSIGTICGSTDRPPAAKISAPLARGQSCRVPSSDCANPTTHPHSQLPPQNYRWRPSRLVHPTASIDASQSQAPRSRRERKVPVLLQQARLTSKCQRWQAVRPAQRRVRRFRGRTDRSDHRPLGPSGLRAKALEPSHHLI